MIVVVTQSTLALGFPPFLFSLSGAPHCRFFFVSGRGYEDVHFLQVPLFPPLRLPVHCSFRVTLAFLLPLFSSLSSWVTGDGMGAWQKAMWDEAKILKYSWMPAVGPFMGSDPHPAHTDAHTHTAKSARRSTGLHTHTHTHTHTHLLDGFSNISYRCTLHLTFTFKLQPAHCE